MTEKIFIPKNIENRQKDYELLEKLINKQLALSNKIAIDTLAKSYNNYYIIVESMDIINVYSPQRYLSANYTLFHKLNEEHFYMPKLYRTKNEAIKGLIYLNKIFDSFNVSSWSIIRYDDWIKMIFSV